MYKYFMEQQASESSGCGCSSKAVVKSENELTEKQMNLLSKIKKNDRKNHAVYKTKTKYFT